MSRTKVDWRSSSKENYKKFCKQYPLIKLSYDEWRNVLYTFSDEFRLYILETGEKIRLPYGLGEFSIVKKKRKHRKGPNDEYINLPIDWKKTKEKGKRMYNFNYHTEGYFFGWIWFKPKVKIKQTAIWFFKPYRTSSRMLAHYIHSDKKYMNLYKEWNQID